MAKFVFPYETLLKLRRQQEEQRQQALAAVMRERTRMMDEVRSIQQQITAAKADLGRSLAGRVDVSRVGQFARFSGQGEQHARELVRQLVGVEQQVDAARQQLLEATKARKALELLRERRLEAWRREQDRRETATLDEFAAQAHARRRQADEP